MTVNLVTRFEILKRDKFTCVYCGQHPPQIQIEVDHIVPLSAGGKDDPGNLVTACHDCNQGKRDRPLVDLEYPNWQMVADLLNQEGDRFRDLFLNREDYGLETFADVVQSLWPEADY